MEMVLGKVNEEKLSYVFVIFLTGCVTGWVYEEVFYLITEGTLQNRGVLYGPWLPIYGTGAVFMYFMKGIKKNPFLLFLSCACIAGIVEYSIGFAGIEYFGMRLWDYRNLFMNVDGIICLRSVVSFGLMGVIFHYLAEPAVEKIYLGLDRAKVNNILAVAAVIFAADIILSILFRTPITY